MDTTSSIWRRLFSHSTPSPIMPKTPASDTAVAALEHLAAEVDRTFEGLREVAALMVELESLRQAAALAAEVEAEHLRARRRR